MCSVSRGRFGYCYLEASFVARMISLSSSDVGGVCSKRQVGWEGRETKRRLNVGVLVWRCLGDGQWWRRTSSMEVVQEWIWQRN
jgi:hypothetical protein